MADNNDKTQPAEQPQINLSTGDLEALRPMLRQIIAEEIATGLSALVARVDALAEDVKRNRDDIKHDHSVIDTLDKNQRETYARYVEAATAAQQIVGTFKGVQELLDQWVAAAAANGRAIIVLQEAFADMKRDIYGDPSRQHNRSIMGELDKLPVYIQSAIKSEVTPVMNRLALNEARTTEHADWIKARKAWEDRAKTVSKAIFSRKTLAGIVSAVLTITATSAATGTNYFEGLLLWIQRNLLGGG